MNSRGEQSLCFRAWRQRVDIDQLWLPTLQGLDIAHEPHRVADARPQTGAAAANRREPLHLTGFEVEEVHDGARNPEQLTQRLKRRRGDGFRQLLGDQGTVDLVQQLQALDRSLQRQLCPGSLGLTGFQPLRHIIERLGQLAKLASIMCQTRATAQVTGAHLPSGSQQCLDLTQD